MVMTQRFLLALILTTLAAAAIGFGAARYLDNGVTAKLKADRDRARDCRQSGATLPPCPVEYRNTRIEWQTKVETRPVPDPAQAERIGRLSADLADAQRTIRDLKGRLAAGWPRRPAADSYFQNGSMAHPYYTADRCPAGTAVVYAAAPSARSMIRGHSGDPNVCYVRIAPRRSSARL
jgi:hypothetical protein